jgi:hypothetical protein
MEPTLQNPTEGAKPTDTAIVDRSEEQIKHWRWQQYIFYCAAGGMRVTEDGDFEPQTVTQFAAEVGVHRVTVYDWPKIIPNFEAHVNRARGMLYSTRRVDQVLKALYLQAIAGNVTAIDMYLRNFYKDYKVPSFKGELEAGSNLASLMMSAKRRKHGERSAEPINVE